MRAPRPTRLHTASSALLLAGVGLVCQRLLVLNQSDNAYLFLWMVGFGLLYVCSGPYAVATALPAGTPRRIAAYVGAGLLWTIAGAFVGLTLPLMMVSFVSSPSVNQVLIVHLIGILLVLSCLFYAGYWIFRSPPAMPADFSLDPASGIRGQDRPRSTDMTDEVQE